MEPLTISDHQRVNTTQSHFPSRLRGVVAAAALTLCGAGLIGTPAALAANPTLTANPNPVILPLGQTTGTTQLSWNTGDSNVFGFVEAGSACQHLTPLGQGVSGTVPAKASYGQPNTFVLCDATAVQLATVSVEMKYFTFPQGINTCSPCSGGGQGSASSDLVLQPSKLLTSVYGDEESSSDVWCSGTGLNTPGEGPAGVPSGGVAVGFSHSYDPGSGILPCWSKNDDFWRGGVGFDMNQINQFAQSHGLKAAHLDFVVDNPAHLACIAQVQVNSDPWESFTTMSPSVLPGGTLQTPFPAVINPSIPSLFRIDLTAILALQAGFGGQPHMHLVFVGTDETQPMENRGCQATLSQFSLDLQGAH